MEKETTALCYISAEHTSFGTALQKALKDFVYENYNRCLILESEISCLMEDINAEKQRLLAENPRWKDVEVRVTNNLMRLPLEEVCKVKDVTWWIKVAGQDTAATIFSANYRLHKF